MRMFPVASLDDIEEFAAHISPVCALHMRREQQDAAAAAAAAVLGLSSSNVAAGGKVTGATQAAADPSSTPSESESATPATGRSPRDHSAGPFNVETFDPTSGGGRQNKANHNNGNHHHAAGGHQPTVLLISVQLRQSCSLVSKPRTSYIRIVQLIRAPSVVEDVLSSVSTGKPLPVFASHVARVIKQRIQEATQIVFVQSCVPATALEVLPAIAAAKGAVVKTELAAVAEDIVQASQMFLDTRQKLREQLKLLKEEFKSLRQTYHGKERELRRASMVGVDMTAGGGGGGMDPIAAAAAVAAQQRAEKIAAAAAAAMQLPKAAADHLTKHNRPANIDILAGMTFKSEEDVAAGEEAVLAFKEQANIEKQDAEREIEGQQKELGTHGDKVLQLRRQMDDLKKKLQTSTYEHAMGMRDLRQVLEQDFQQLQGGGGTGPTAATQHHNTVSMVRQLRLSAGGTRGGTASKSKGIASSGGNSTTLLSTSAQPSRILMMATSQLSTSALSDNTTTAGTTTKAVISPGDKSRAVKTAQQLRSDNSSMESFLADLIRQRNEKQQILDKAVITLDKKRRTQENTTELCERHVAALRDYCMDLYAVFKHVEHQARLTHSVDDALAASQLEAYEGVQHVDQRLIRMPREAL
ncbi:Hypothetical protein, putative [Bodo saltans]|uniref:Uncharacterized protein n=1 Tax=Bodo saltans TaxID=75058 RepID=A0A0S4IR62_BODSA|nr:Hypothetical protein, putative [Bodo saltans]|eukprot:CUF40245.1 Hypothetical protein, putative [Bodo saltans]